VGLGAHIGYPPRVSEPKFKIGHIVRHTKFDYRAVVVDVQDHFGLSDDWYERVARSRPPKDKPWYRILVNDTQKEAYVAEQHLEAEVSGEPIVHPLLDLFFDSFHGDHYSRSNDPN
jgi:heat shock protein HspQ